MTFEEYIKKTALTDHKDELYDKIAKSVEEEDVAITHYVLGIVSEAGEIADLLKKDIQRHPQISERSNYVEELGDLMWYIARLCYTLKIPLEEVLDNNIKKLRKRYAKKIQK